MNIILFGPPGAGKGTQAQKLVENHNYHQISTGDLLRNEVNKKSTIGEKIEKLISKGEFVSDEIVNDLLRQTLSKFSSQDRIIFDGYPRSISQASNLELILNDFERKINFVISLNVSRDIIQKRIMGRVTCEKCNITLNEFFDQERIEKLTCSGKYLVKRKDDNLETILSRYDKYIETTKPVLDFFAKKIPVHQVDGTLKIEEITSKIKHIIKG